MNGRPENFASAFIYSDELANFEYSPTHPFKPIRAKLTLDLCRRYDLIDRPWIRIVKPEPLPLEVMAEFHDETYLKALQAVDLQPWPVNSGPMYPPVMKAIPSLLIRRSLNMSWGPTITQYSPESTIIPPWRREPP